MEELEKVAYELAVVCARNVGAGQLDNPVLMFVSCFNGVQRLIDTRETNSKRYYKVLREGLINYAE